MFRARSFLFVVLICLAWAARADFESAVSDFSAGSYEMAAAKFKPLAEAGLPTAQYYLGMMFEEGHGLKRDDGLAFFWYRQAAEGGDLDAFFALGQMYALGRGIHKDPMVAWIWYDIAAAAGHRLAQIERDRNALQLNAMQIEEAADLSRAWQAALNRR